MNKIRNGIISFSLSIVFIISFLGTFSAGSALVDKTFDTPVTNYFGAYSIRLLDEPEKALARKMYDCLNDGQSSKLEKLSRVYDFKYYTEYDAGNSVFYNMKWFEVVASQALKFTYGYDGSVSPKCTIYIYLNDVETKAPKAVLYKVFKFFSERFGLSVAVFTISIVLFALCIYALIINASTLYKIFFAVFIVGVVEAIGLLASFPENTREILAIISIEKIILIGILYFYYFNFMRLKNRITSISDIEKSEKKKAGTYPYSMRSFSNEIDNVKEKLREAIDERIKSERLKTELISNVSHDIKTPLTSIINFSDLIYKEQTDNAIITEYAGHLHDQSLRMKDMMEALIEASKASVGAVEINLIPCNVQTILEQSFVEYEERLLEKEISLIETPLEKEVYINADVKALNRIFDNLISNIYKYAAPGSKAYIEPEITENEVVLSFKNVSKDILRINAEELSERFVRGDESRHSEGHGLGLSIVRSLMELMGGRLELSANSIMFEAKLYFECVQKND